LTRIFPLSRISWRDSRYSALVFLRCIFRSRLLRSRFASLQRELLSLIVLHCVGKGVVVGAAVGGNFAQQEIQVARGGHRSAAGLIFRRVGRVIALDRRSGGR